MSDANVSAVKFVKVFHESYQAKDADKAKNLYSEYVNQRANYSGFTLFFYTELLGSDMDNLRCGEATGLDSLTAEHMKNCHSYFIDHIGYVIHLNIIL